MLRFFFLNETFTFSYAREEEESLKYVLGGINLDPRNRKLAIIINPISGRQRASMYFEEVLEPQLRLVGIEYENFTTTSATWIEDWVAQLKPNSYTEFVIVGGDGMFVNFVNAVYKHPDADQLLNLPIGILPGGTTNALCCDLGGKTVEEATVNLIRGEVVEGDMLEINFEKSGKKQISSFFIYGIVADIVHDSENWRSLLGTARYLACGAK